MVLVLPDPFTGGHRDAIVARHRLPAVYPFRFFITSGGLMSYGPDIEDIYRRSADYIDRILKGAKPSELPVQYPTKFRAGGQFEDGKGAWHHRRAIAPRRRR